MRRVGQHGFTLAEVLIACVVLAFAVVSVTQMVVAGQQATYEALHHRRGQSLAEALVDEILARPYDDPDGPSAIGPDADQIDRADFDNVDDYHGYSEALGDIADAQGVLYGGAFERFSRSVSITPANHAMAGLADPLVGVEITVTVTDDRGLTWTITRFVAEGSP